MDKKNKNGICEECGNILDKEGYCKECKYYYEDNYTEDKEWEMIDNG